jgi:predicted nucleic acid-binding protein
LKQVVVDTNVLVSFLTDRNLKQQGLAQELFEAASGRELGLILHQAVLSELVYVLRNLYQVETAEIAATLRSLLALPGIEVVDEIAWTRLLDLWPGRFPDFADAILSVVMKEQGADCIATFDQRFFRILQKEGQVSFWSLRDLS